MLNFQGKAPSITVLGGGLWGTVLAQQLAEARPRPARLRLWEFFPKLAAELERTRRHPHLPGFRLDPTVAVGAQLESALRGASVVLVVLPSSVVRRAARAAKPFLPEGALVVNASKGIEPESLQTMGQILEREWPQAKSVFTLSGPSFAREVARGVRTKLLLAGPRGSSAEALRRLLSGGAVRVEPSADRIGVELGGSLKNVLAIGCGILDGLNAAGDATGANSKAALIIQGMDEMSRLIKACGGHSETIYGLAGLGDLIATGTSPESRNRAFGEKLGRGKSARQACAEIPTVIEGIEAAQSARALCRRRRIRAPLIESIWSAVHRGRPSGTVLKALGF